MPSHTRGYDHVWRKFRLIVLAEEPLCRHCLAEGKLTATAHIDHIIPVSIRPDLRLVRENTQGLCQACHNKKTVKEKLKRN